jgi:RND family efflux transporter MFP subunit
VVLQPELSGFEIKVHGVVVPRRETTVSAEIAGRIIEKHESFRSGRFVESETKLLVIDSQSYELELAMQANRILQIESDLKRIEVEAKRNKTQIDIAQRELTIANRELQRNRSLAAEDVVAQQQRDASERTVLRSQNALSTLEAARELFPFQRNRAQTELKLAKLMQQSAQLDLDHTVVAAPFDGLITAEQIEVGAYVQAGDALFAIEESSAVEVKCHLRTDDLFWLWAQDAARTDDSGKSAYEVPRANVRVAYRLAGQKFLWQGQLSRYEGAGVDERTRTVPCRVNIRDRRQAVEAVNPPTLMRGMFVTVVIPVAPGVEMLKIPERALQPNGQVWAIEDERLRVHAVTPARSLDDGILIRADQATLKSDDRVVVSRLITAHDGMQVRERAAP